MKRVISIGIFGVVALAAFILLVNTYIVLSTYMYIYQSVAVAPSAEAVLIPGAAILANGKPSPIFIDRVDTAIALYNAEKVAKILVSGDNSTVSHNEVNPVHLYLLEKGIPDEDIFLDHAGFDTYSSMYRASAIFGVSSMLIATQSFHLPRALFIARELGIDVYGVNADSGHILFHNYAREIFSNEKALFDVVFHTRPKYLGDKIPILGDGRDYP
ncbi:MAG: YdcF family protein [Patescibacteria group bacterium]|nr:YdcF family protein [Patescibacteria group bacterium]